MNIDLLEQNFKYSGWLTHDCFLKDFDRKPKWKTVILTCMDSRITSKTLSIEKAGDSLVIRTAGALLTHDSLRSLLIAIYELEIDTIIVIGHTDCGGIMDENKMESVIRKIAKRSKISPKNVLQNLNASSANQALLGFVNVNNQIQETIKSIKNHPLIPSEILVYGFVYDVMSGEFNRI
ncbi:MAG: beta-class carbonic anhydrase [Candidatus Hodarchaeales archaeon]